MKIKQAEELVGITSKNIRFYEEQGLIFPKRADNGYREYLQQDISILKKIKLFRKFGISVEDIKSVFEGKKNLEECLSNQIEVFQREKENISHMEELVKVMLSDDVSIQNLDTDYWLEQIEHMEKEGTYFVNISKVDIHMKKKAGAIAGAAIFIMSALIGIIALLWANSYEHIPLGILILFIAILMVLIVGLVAALIGRIKEIEGGEEDEASKY